MVESSESADATKPRKGMPATQLSEQDFKLRYGEQFTDPAFRAAEGEIDKIADIAWQAYHESRKAPITEKAGVGFKNPDYDLSVDWIAASKAITAAQVQHDAKDGPPRILLINGSSRSEHTCPGEMSKSFRLIELAKTVIETEFSLAVDILICRVLPRNTVARSTPAKPAFRPQRLCAIGPVRATPTMQWARRRTG